MLFADLELARRLEKKEMQSIINIAAGFAKVYPGIGAELNLLDEGYAIFTGRNQPINRVFNLGMSGPLKAETLLQAEDFYHKLEMPTEVEACPLADTSLFKLLAQRQYTAQRFINVFFRSLEDYEPAAEVVSNIKIRQATASEDELWARAVGVGFAGAGENLTDSQYALMKAIFHRPDALLFLAWVDDEIAGGGLLSMEDGVAGLSTASTLTQFWERGVQTALLQARLTYAVQSGCDLATIHATPGSPSQRNIQRAGFQVAYTNVEMLREVF